MGEVKEEFDLMILWREGTVRFLFAFRPFGMSLKITVFLANPLSQPMWLCLSTWYC
jgi:hypothetical protein